jgi:hypothetical protein
MSDLERFAILPLENLSGDASQDYFSDGMTDELIAELGQITELRVISRTSEMTYKTAASSRRERRRSRYSGRSIRVMWPSCPARVADPRPLILNHATGILK